MNEHLRLGRALKAFNDFVREWVPSEYHGHLLDDDNNSGERVRRAIRDASSSLAKVEQR